MNIQQFNDVGFQNFNKQFEKFKIELKKSDYNDFIARLVDEIDIYRVPEIAGEKPIITMLHLITVLNILTDWQNKILLINMNLQSANS